MKRSNYCGRFTESDVGSTATAMGWVHTRRDMGGVIFIDLRDREGTLQVVCSLSRLPGEQFAVAERLKSESVIAVSGKIYIRDEETYNPKLKTGTIELRAETLELLSEASKLPFSVEGAGAVREELRLKYRYLDMRRPEMLHNLRFRHKLQFATEQYLNEREFMQVETPMLTVSTPEGARDYLVPSRVHPGSFYALPQSPQIFKQLLMVGGIDRYYQVARCFRDEDLRADRQPEFTQVDMEMAFATQEEILDHLEDLFASVYREVMGEDLALPFKHLTWREAMDMYGSDKPDLRFDLPIVDITEIAKDCSFSVFAQAAKDGGVVRAINAKGCADFTRTQIETLTDEAVKLGAKGMAWIALRPDGELYSVFTKYFQEDEMQALLQAMDAKPGDFILFSADKLKTVRRVLGGLRLILGDMLGLRDPAVFQFATVTEFPQFEYSEEEGRYISAHHPFTMPYKEDLPYLLSEPGRVRSQAYDVVLNGVELGSGSIRIHDSAVQEQMFAALGLSEEDVKERFGFFVEAFRYGTPPHGGFAFGLDRLAMLLLGQKSLRDVIAFPKLKDASCPLTGAPGGVDPQQLEVLDLLAAVGGGEGGKAGETADRIDVDGVAGLAKLEFDKKDARDMAGQMGAILDFAAQLEQIDTSDIPVQSHVQPVKNVFRADVAGESQSRDELLAVAPKTKDGMLHVPKTME